jgi:hypothetical protein
LSLPSLCQRFALAFDGLDEQRALSTDERPVENSAAVHGRFSGNPEGRAGVALDLRFDDPGHLGGLRGSGESGAGEEG